jgi:hypothetical protein
VAAAWVSDKLSPGGVVRYPVPTLDCPPVERL